jgi:hypothetical protein
MEVVWDGSYESYQWTLERIREDGRGSHRLVGRKFPTQTAMFNDWLLQRFSYICPVQPGWGRFQVTDHFFVVFARTISVDRML